MIEILTDHRFNRKIITGEWRYSATSLGILRCLRHNKCDYLVEGNTLYYNIEDIMNSDIYNRFVEHYYYDYMHHCQIELLLSRQTELSDEMVKFVNQKMTANTITKKLFKDVTFDGSNHSVILNIIKDNRNDLIENTFKNAKFGYACYCNSRCFKSDANVTCRLLGFNVDAGRKTKGVSYNWDQSALIAYDFRELDFIPFAFTPTYQSYFINNNYSVELLDDTNRHLNEQVFAAKINAQNKTEEPINVIIQKTIFFSMITSANFIYHDVEIITKNRAFDYFETRYLRKPAIDIFKQITSLNYIHTDALKYSIKLDSEDRYLNLLETVTYHVVNLIKLDNDIEKLIHQQIKNGQSFNAFKIEQLIKINECIYQCIHGSEMKVKNKNSIIALKTAEKIVKDFIAHEAENKLVTYRYKLLSNLIAHDYDRFNEVLLQLASYSQVPLTFAYDLFEDFESNKNLAYTFVNALENYDRKGGEKNEE